MEINLFSFVLLFIIIQCFTKNKEIKKIYISIAAVTAIVEIFIEQGNFITIGTFRVSYAILMKTIMFIFSAYMIFRKKKIPKKVFTIAMLLIVVVAFGVLHLMINPLDMEAGTYELSWDDVMKGASLEKIHYTSYVLKQAIQLFIFVISMLGIYITFEKEDYKEFIFKIGKGIKFMLVLGIVELLIKEVFHSNLYNSLCISILGNSVQAYTELMLRGSGYMLQGLTQEGSHYAYALMISIIVLTALHTITKKEKRWIFIAVVIIIMSMSFSTYWFLIGVFAIWIIKWIQKSSKQETRLMKFAMILLIIGILGTTLLVNLNSIYNNLEAKGFLERRIKSLIEEVDLVLSNNWLTAENSLEWSNRVRIGSSYETLKLTLYRPLFGVGIAAATSHGSTTMLLSRNRNYRDYFMAYFLFWIYKNEKRG